MELPVFKYHPDPIKTGAIQKTDAECECCEKRRGYRATSSIYALEEVEDICPWCIADGSAVAKFGGAFSDSHPLQRDKIEESIIKEVCERTPSFTSWQQERWLSHCGDACEFHGDAEKSDISALSGDDLNEFLAAEFIDKEAWPKILITYEKGGGFAIYKFKCRSCGKYRYYSDCD